MHLQQPQNQEEQHEQQLFMQEEEKLPIDRQEETSGKTVSNAREGETLSHEDETFPPLEPEAEKEASSQKENVAMSSQVEFREPEKLAELGVSVESSPEVSERLSLDPQTGLPEGWHRTKHERVKGSPYYQIKPAGSKILRSQIEVNSYVQQQGIKLKILLNGPATKVSPKKKINLKKRTPLLPSSSEELEERGEEATLEDKNSELGLPKTGVERVTDDEERELKELLEERDNIYQIPTSERTAAQNTRIGTLQKKILKLKKKCPEIKVKKRVPLKRKDEKKDADTKNKEPSLVPSKVIESKQDMDMSKETKRKKKKKKVPITPSEVVENNEDTIGPV